MFNQPTMDAPRILTVVQALFLGRLERLAADWDLLGQSLFGGVAPGALTGFNGDDEIECS